MADKEQVEFDLQVRVDITALRIISKILLDVVAPTEEARQALKERVKEAATDPRRVPSFMREDVEKALSGLISLD